MNTNTTSAKRVGAPEKSLTFPVGTFTIKDLKSTGLSRVTLQLKVNKALEAATIVEVGTDKTQRKMGRPATVYQIA